MHDTGTVVRVLYVTRAPDNTVLLFVQGLKRFLITEWTPGKDFLKAKIKLIPETIERDIEIEALHRSLRDLTQEIFALTFSGPDEVIEKLTRIDDPLHLAYIAAAYSEIDFETRQALLEEDSLKAKLRKLLKILSREKEIPRQLAGHGLKDSDVTFKETDVHLHVPAGAIPKDGPSAGVVMVLAQARLYSNCVVGSNVGMHEP